MTLPPAAWPPVALPPAASPSAALRPVPLRLHPGDDLRGALRAVLQAHGVQAGFVLAGIGSLAQTRLRLAGADAPRVIDGAVEILSLVGSLASDGEHLHMSVADARGLVLGGHVAPGCVVRTTAELLIALLPTWRFCRAPDAVTGHDELVIEPMPQPGT